MSKQRELNTTPAKLLETIGRLTVQNELLSERCDVLERSNAELSQALSQRNGEQQPEPGQRQQLNADS